MSQWTEVEQALKRRHRREALYDWLTIGMVAALIFGVPRLISWVVS